MRCARNAWMIQTLAAGVHGICSATPKARSGPPDDRSSALSVRPRADGLAQGHAGTGRRATLRLSWGVNLRMYADRRSLAAESGWRVAVRPEDRESARRRQRGNSVRDAGYRLCGVGPGDHGFFIMGRPGTYKGGGETDPNMAAVRRRVLNATKAAGVKFLNACNEKNGRSSR